MVIEEYNGEGGGSLNIIIQRNETGEQKILTVRDASSIMTADGVKKIQQMSDTEAANLSTRDKLIWFNNRID